MSMSRPQANSQPPAFEPTAFLQAALLVSRRALLQLRLRTFGLCVRKNVAHSMTSQVLGFQSNNWSSNHRIMQIARKEVSQELRLIGATIPTIMSWVFGPSYGNNPGYIFLLREADRLVDSSWPKVIQAINPTRAKNCQPEYSPPTVLSNAELSADTMDLLAKGPKYAPDSSFSRVDQLAATHQVAARIPDQDRPQFLGAAIQSVCSHPAPRPSGSCNTRSTVKELRVKNLTLLQADKTGEFVVLDRGAFQEKVLTALSKNFTKLGRRPSGGRRAKVKDLCEKHNLPKLKSSVASPSNQYLSVFFSAKTHKPDIPLRSRVSETGCWQKHLAKFLQSHLSILTPPQPFRIRSSQELVSAISPLHQTTQPISMFSMDVEDMHYSLNVPFLVQCVTDAIEEHGLPAFQNSCGISTQAFLELLQLYLRSTLIEHNGDVFIQKAGVCIGSCLAPSLSEIYLSVVDRGIQQHLRTKSLDCDVFRYVDDYLIILYNDTTPAAVTEAFGTSPGHPTFKREDPTKGELQFLEVRLQSSEGGVCWSFQQRTTKPVLPFSSAHSKNVKTGIVRCPLSSVCSKSCAHQREASINQQCARLQRAGYPKDLILATLQKLVTKPRPKPATKTSPATRRPACIPYIHTTSHRIKALASEFNTKVVFTCRSRLGDMCRTVNSEGPPLPCCTKKHATKFTACKTEKVYAIPLSCGAKYIGQTRRCLNDRLREHHMDAKNAAPDSQHPIVTHGRKCPGCAPNLAATTTLGSHRERVGREIIEAFRMATSPQNIGAPSISLSQRELVFLKPTLNVQR